MSTMTLGEAWAILGRDPGMVIASLKKPQGFAARLKAAEKAFTIAQRLARDLMAKNHPDKNPGDQTAVIRFRQVGQALESIEYHTKEFRRKVEEIQKRGDNPPDGFIITDIIK
jgi:hypothetical protein